MNTVYTMPPKITGQQKMDAESVAARARKRRNYPPYCNTGGYEFSQKIQNSRPVSDLHITNIDWLRLTVTDLASYNATLSDVAGEGGILEQADIDIKWTDKGMHGYEKSAVLKIWRDNDHLTVGNIATSETGRNRGGMFELTGVGCKVLQIECPDLWLELFDVLQYHEWRISRVDIALDLPGTWCKEKHYTVPMLFKQAVNEGLFQSDNLRNPNMKQTFNMAGDWSDLTVGNIQTELYDPLTDCPGGLTAYVGNRKSSDDFFRVYEKGKELLGKDAEPDSVDRGWIRIEHEMSRKASGKAIPLDVMIRPDAYFALHRSGVRFLMDEYRLSMDAETARQAQREQFKREKNLVLSKKIHWAKHSYGRLFRTLTDKGITPQEIIDWLSRADGLKEFVFDIAEDGKAKEIKRNLLEVAA